MDIVALMSPEGRRDERANPFGSFSSMAVEVGLGLTEAFVYSEKRSYESFYQRKVRSRIKKKLKVDASGKLANVRSSDIRTRSIVRQGGTVLRTLPLTARQKYSMAENIAARNYLTTQFTAIGASLAFSFASMLTKPKINKIAVQRDHSILYDESFLDTAAAYTQRQRALQAIMDNQMNAQHIIGNEAVHMHR